MVGKPDHRVSTINLINSLVGSELVVISDKKQVKGSESVVIYFREKVVNRYSLRSDYLEMTGGNNIVVICHVQRDFTMIHVL